MFLLLAAAACQEIQEKTVDVSSVTVSPSTLALVEGESSELTATVLPSNATDKDVTWSCSPSDYVSVDGNGKVTALREGSATVTAMAGGKKGTCSVTVSAKVVPVSKIVLDATSLDLIVGDTHTLSVTMEPADATDKTVSWATSDAAVATVEGGLVTAVSPGEATISVSTADGALTATCKVNVSAPFSYGGMCLEAVSDGAIVISNPNLLTIEYKVETKDWTSSGDASISIQAKAGERVWFRGNNDSYTTGNPENGFRQTTFSCYNGYFYLYGNLMSLVYGDDYENKTELTGEYVFYQLFSQNNSLINHPSKDIELSATTLSKLCYRNMFYACSGLTRAPKLPAKVLAEGCYAAMFANCTSLKEFPEMAATDMAYMSCTWMMMGTGIEVAPELPAQNLAKSCYEFMFSECPNLKKAMSVLPATDLADNCYTGMFQRCEKLENAPVLPATELKSHCYSHMFNGCMALTKAPKLPATKLAEACYQRMFGNSGLTEAPELPAMDLEVMCYEYMFEGSKSLTKAPVLPALHLNSWCYGNMFHDCSSLNYIKADFLTKPSSVYTYNWVDGVAAEGTFVKNPEASWDVRGVNGIPEGWSVE